MPELPEVEIVRRGVARAFEGLALTGVSVRQPQLRWPVPANLALLAGNGVLREARRRSKYLLLGFDAGTIIIHLGMSGTLRRLDRPVEPGLHDHVDLHFGSRTLRLNDPRRFGAVLWSGQSIDATIREHPRLAGLGVEPFSDAFDAGWMRNRMRGRRGSIKQMLLSGQVVVGVGNIYACESLFRAGIRPTVAAGSVSLARLERLVREIRAVLSEAIEAGGSSLKNFVSSEGTGGCFQTLTQVYDREGLPCRACATPVRRIVQQQRATYFCPNCQRR